MTEDRSRQAYADYCDAEGNHEEEPMAEVKVHLAKIVQTARAVNGEFLPLDDNDHLVLVDDHVYRRTSEVNARAQFEFLVGGAESVTTQERQP